MLYNTVFFYICAVFYLAGMVLYDVYIWKKEPAFFSYSKQWIGAGFIAGSLFFFIRYRELSFLPLVSLFEITFFYGWLLSGVYILFVKEGAGRFIQGLTLFMIASILLLDLFLDKRLHQLNPLLNSFWLGIHVPAAMLSYSAFGLSFAVSVYYIIAENKRRPIAHLGGLNSGLIMSGEILLGIGILTGAIWARSAWGRFWNWDPKETWALVTFIIYGCAAMMGRVTRFKMRWQAITSIVGFTAMLLTFFGVSLLMASHHAYR
jgi:ABC-type transport system involved in cytochrome c biogenesis permease subunit